MMTRMSFRLQLKLMDLLVRIQKLGSLRRLNVSSNRYTFLITLLIGKVFEAL
jgi:hypothetical protein